MEQVVQTTVKFLIFQWVFFFKVHTVVTMLSAGDKPAGSCVQEKLVLVVWLFTSYNVYIGPGLSLRC